MKDEPTQVPMERERILRRYLAFLRRTNQEDIALQIESILWAPIPEWEDR